MKNSTKTGNFDPANKKHAEVYNTLVSGVSWPKKAEYSRLIAKLLNVDEESVFNFMIEEERFWVKMRREYKEEQKKTRKLIYEYTELFKKHLPSFIKQAKKSYELSLKSELFKTLAKAKSSKSIIHLQKADELNKKLKSLDLDADLIETAKNTSIQEYLGTKKRLIRCPFHDDKTPSLDISNNFFYCYGCGARGNTIKFVMETENIDFKEAVRRLAFH